jgi:hypothetical protein
MTPGIANDTLGSQMPYEVNVTRTVDGTKLLVKWIDVVNDTDAVSQQVYPNQDIFVAVREIGNSTWTKTKNITQSNMPNHITWIPDMIPNDLKNIPILKTESIPKATDNTLNAQLATAYTLNPQPQVVKVGHFDADILLDVKDYNYNPKSKIELMGIYPNPSDKQSHVDINLPFDGNVNIDLYDLMGNKLSMVYNGNLSYGINSVNINTSGLSSGAYLLSVSCEGQKISKLINVLH